MAGGNALNPDIPVEPLEASRIGTLPMADINQALRADRERHWEGRGGEFDEQLQAWNESFARSFDQKRERGLYDTPEGQRALSLYTAFGLDGMNMTKKSSQEFYDAFLREGTSDAFVSTVISRYKDRPLHDFGQDLAIVQDLAQIFGREHGAEIVSNLIELRKHIDGDGREEFVRRVNETLEADGEEKIRIV